MGYSINHMPKSYPQVHSLLVTLILYPRQLMPSGQPALPLVSIGTPPPTPSFRSAPIPLGVITYSMLQNAATLQGPAAPRPCQRSRRRVGIPARAAGRHMNRVTQPAAVNYLNYYYKQLYRNPLEGKEWTRKSAPTKDMAVADGTVHSGIGRRVAINRISLNSVSWVSAQSYYYSFWMPERLAAIISQVSCGAVRSYKNSPANSNLNPDLT